MSEAPFKVGQHVRVLPEFRRMRWNKTPTGVVVWVEPPSQIYTQWWVGVRRDGVKRAVSGFWQDHLEAVPVSELTLDQTAQQLAGAVLAGDVSAALGLADRVFELCGGTKTA